MRNALRLSLGGGALAGGFVLSGCASLGAADPLRVNLVGITALPGEGLELRFQARLRVQNPSEISLDYDGVSLELDLRDMSFASGVSSERGTVQRFSEAVIAVPVTVSATALLRQGLSLLQGQSRITSIPYRLRGRLGGFSLGNRSFDARGQVDWPPVSSTPAAAPGSV